MTTVLRPPRRAGSRERASELLAGLPASLGGRLVVLDCSELAVAPPSFIDELIVRIVIERGASTLEFRRPLQRTAGYAMRYAHNRLVADRVFVSDVRPDPD